MYSSIFPIHKIAVILFLLIYIVKTVLLLTNSKSYDKLAKAIKIPEMIISTTFLATGIYLFTQLGDIRPLFIAKIGVVIVAIVVGVIGFKKKNKALAVLTLALIIGAYGMAEVNRKQMTARQELPDGIITDASDANYDMTAHGEALFRAHCRNCHGADGTQKMSGAANLKESVLPHESVVLVVTEGQNAMPSYKGDFSGHEIDAIAKFAMTLRK